MFGRTATMILGLAIAAANVASAASVLTTPPVMTGSGELKKCSVLNVGKKAITVDVESIRAENGSVFSSTSNCAVDPGLQGCTATDFGIGANYCRFTLIKGSKKSIRAQIELIAADSAAVVLSAQPNVSSAASVLTTPPLITLSGDLKTCSVLNVGKKAITVDVENIRALDGTVFSSTPNCTVQPGLQGCTASDFGNGENYCRFTLIKGSRKSIRATLGLSSGGTDKVVLLAQ